MVAHTRLICWVHGGWVGGYMGVQCIGCCCRGVVMGAWLHDLPIITPFSTHAHTARTIVLYWAYCSSEPSTTGLPHSLAPLTTHSLIIIQEVLILTHPCAKNIDNAPAILHKGTIKTFTGKQNESGCTNQSKPTHSCPHELHFT